MPRPRHRRTAACGGFRRNAARESRPARARRLARFPPAPGCRCCKRACRRACSSSRSAADQRELLRGHADEILLGEPPAHIDAPAEHAGIAARRIDEDAVEARGRERFARLHAVVDERLACCARRGAARFSRSRATRIRKDRTRRCGLRFASAGRGKSSCRRAPRRHRAPVSPGCGARRSQASSVLGSCT